MKTLVSLFSRNRELLRLSLPVFLEQAVTTLLAYLGQLVISGDGLSSENGTMGPEKKRPDLERNGTSWNIPSCGLGRFVISRSSL